MVEKSKWTFQMILIELQVTGLGILSIICGLIMRSTVSFLDGDWRAISAKHGKTMWLKVKDKFEIGSGRQENVLQAFVISTTQRLFRSWKTWLQKDYLRYKTNEERLSHRPEDVSVVDWEYLVHHFGSPEFQAVSARNKLNRQKQTTKHSCGSKSFAEVEESTGHIQTLVTQQQSEENENPMTGDEILATNLESVWDTFVEKIMETSLLERTASNKQM
ncbi:hypothetical protein HAX54_012688 [Datura stramonium]|uniref:Uncharacterized protein n=1 Tax=Datura stramonium TaxID=4076 RepID=A0ABS8TK59_DATST|nr:hypothetical protein [Datura stramonium]